MKRPADWTARRSPAGPAAVAAAVLLGCGGEPGDSMALVHSDPRLTVANVLDPEGSGREGAPGQSTLVDALDALRATRPGWAEVFESKYRKIYYAHSKDEQRRMTLDLASEIRAEVAAESSPPGEPAAE